jgi:hypothetical protein
MIQILIWAVCVVIVGIGFCGRLLAKIASGADKKSTAADLFPVVMGFLAFLLFALSFVRAAGISDMSYLP